MVDLEASSSDRDSSVVIVVGFLLCCIASTWHLMIRLCRIASIFHKEKKIAVDFFDFRACAGCWSHCSYGGIDCPGPFLQKTFPLLEPTLLVSKISLMPLVDPVCAAGRLGCAYTEASIDLVWGTTSINNLCNVKNIACTKYSRRERERDGYTDS